VDDIGYNPYPYDETQESLIPRLDSYSESSVSVESEDETELQELKGWRMLYLWIPALCDILGTSLSNVALIYTSASIYQMLRGSIVFTTGILSVVVLRRHLAGYQWFSLFLVMAGIAIVGATPLLQARFGGDPHNLFGLRSNAESGQFLGVWMVLLAQVFTSVQFIIEERLLSGFKVHPLLAVGLEGSFGLLSLFVLVPPIWWVYGRHHLNSYFNIVEGFKDFTSNPVLPLTGLGSIFSVAIFNWCGLEVTRRISATSRSTIDACRTLLIWGVSLAIGWEHFSIWQVIGFVGTFFPFS
jgi:drug/metabolite transporter (DMT)-like permease